MSDVTISMRTDLFFDRAKIMKAVDDGTRRSMSKGLAFIRKRARSSIRRSKKSSVPGQPPRAHSTSPVASIKNIQFYYDTATKSGICGPVKLNGYRKIKTAKPVPATLEFGGTVRFLRGAYAGGGKARRGKPNKLYVVKTPFAKRILARPFMQPALEKEVAAGNVLSAWKGQVHE